MISGLLFHEIATNLALLSERVRQGGVIAPVQQA
jgi:hypothetical protein